MAGLNALTNRWFPIREHSRVQAFWITGSTLGTAVGGPVVTALMLASGWRGTLAALSLVSLLPIALFCFVRDWPREQKGINPSELRDIESDRKVAGAAELPRIAEEQALLADYGLPVCVGHNHLHPGPVDSELFDRLPSPIF